MKDKTVEVNGNLVNLEDISEISELVHKNKSNNLPFGYSIVLKDHSIINIIGDSNKQSEESKNIVSSYQIIKNYLKK